MDKLIDLITPYLGPILNVALLLLLVGWALKKYREISKEQAEIIDAAISAKLGTILGQVQQQVSEIARIKSDAEAALELINSELEERKKDFADRAEEISQQYAEAQSKLTELRGQIPDVSEESSSDIYYKARAEEDRLVRAALCEKLLAHSDPLAKDLEFAGDIMRNDGRNALARRLYEAASTLDPDRETTRVELLALEIETSAGDRPRAIAEAKAMMATKPDVVGIGRFSDALIDIGRYQDLLELNEGILAAADAPGQQDMILPRNVRLMALRNKAVALRQLGRAQEALATYEQAFAIDREDGNTLKAYLVLLNDLGRDDEYLDVAERLIRSSPDTVRYYVQLANKLADLGRWQEAGLWFERARELQMDPSDADQMNRLARRLIAAARLAQADQAAEA